MFASFVDEVRRARQDVAQELAALLPEEVIDEAAVRARATSRGWIYTIAATVYTCIYQCLSPDHSCRDAVARMNASRMAAGQEPASSATGGYCSARDRLSEELCEDLVRTTGADVEEWGSADWNWNGRRVRIVDGSTITMPDTPANQSEYPQKKGCLPGCGFPIARIVVVFCLSVGTVLHAATGKYQGKLTGENSMFRQLHDVLDPGDVVVADRYSSG